LPIELLFRKKSPYPKTYNPNYEFLLKQMLSNTLQNANAPINEYLDKGKANSFLESSLEYKKPWFGQLMAGPQMIAYLLQVNEWLRMYSW
jgi:asparagine synthase (glutamine-hydrolysing)